jgi:endonuclease YncB( thermonuclease family)
MDECKREVKGRQIGTVIDRDRLGPAHGSRRPKTSSFMTPLLAAIPAVAINTAQVAEGVIEGRVVGVSDDDTITVLERGQVQHKIHLSGIDAPEKGQPSGNASKENLSRLIDRQIEVRCRSRDRYCREGCAVFIGSRDAGLEQVRAGMAWWYRECAKEQTP